MPSPTRQVALAGISLLAIAAAPPPPVAQTPLTITPTPVVYAPPAPPPPSPESYLELMAATDAWKTGDTAKAAAAYAETDKTFKAKGKSAVEKQFLADWILALTLSDPAAAQAKLDAWDKDDPRGDALTGQAMLRFILQTRIAIRRSGVEGAAVAVEARRRDMEAARAALATDLAARRKAGEKRARIDYAKSRPLDQAEPGLRAAEFLIATARTGEAAFPRFSGSYGNPFRSSEVSAFIGGRNTVSCASSGLEPGDWMIAELAFDTASRKTLVLPFAQSRDAVIEHFLAAMPEWGSTYQGRLSPLARSNVFVRCTRSAPPATDTRPDYDYLLTYFRKGAPPSDKPSDFNIFRDPLTNLVRDNEMWMLVRTADRLEPLAPDVQRRAQTLLLSELHGEKRPDQVAIAIAEQWALREPEVGRPGSARNLLPSYLAALVSARAVPNMPPRVLAFMELRVAELHEMSGDAVSAKPIYQAIAARPAEVLPEKSFEMVKAKLRLAALADAAGKPAEADTIIADLGLSPAQCSLYQAKPAIAKMPEPYYRTAELQDEIQGSVQFEFDISEAGGPANFRVIVASPPFVFDQATIASFAKASFVPATRGGKALPCEAATQGFVWRMPN